MPHQKTLDLRIVIRRALDRAGGEDYLVGLAQTDPRTFCALLAKVLPTNVEVSADNSLAALLVAANAQARARLDGGGATLPALPERIVETTCSPVEATCHTPS